MIPAALLTQSVMLATQSKGIARNPGDAVSTLVRQGDWWFDPKIDGIRCVAYVDEGKVRLINRREVDITFRYPEIVANLQAIYPTGSIVLDGEIACMNDGKPDFARAHRRDAQASAAAAAKLVPLMPATYLVFDLICMDGDDLRRLPYTGRRAMLRHEAESRFVDQPAVSWCRSEADGVTMWDFVLRNGLEGLIAKRATSRYHAGRSTDWVKLKVVHTISVVAVGYTAGKGSRTNMIGAVRMALIGPDGPIEIGEVGTGFTQADLHALKPRLDAKELVVLEVAIGNMTKDGKCRFPSYKGIRTDIDPTDCTIDQLDGIAII